MSYTPGPWQWVQHDKSMLSLEGRDGMVHHVLSHGPCKACQPRISDDESVMGRCTVVGLEDSRLIAAAPDMAEALRNAIRDMDAAYDALEKGWTDEPLLCLGHHLPKLRAALAKAGL